MSGKARLYPQVRERLLKSSAFLFGILIMTRESLESAMDRTIAQPNADQMYKEAERAVSEALTKYQAQELQSADLPSAE